MPSRRTVSAALIVRNEERFLPGCLESLGGRVDEIVIVDTGSDDASVEIARNAGAAVLHHQWENDFSAARNVALNAASSDWILYIDADERLSLPAGGRLADHLDDAAIAAYVRFRPKSGYTRYREARVFRNDPRLRFSGKIHETIMPILREISATEGAPIIQTPIELDHFGYDGDQSHKHERNLPLLEISARAHPERVFYWHHLAETLKALGRPEEALEAAQAGLKAASQNPSDKQSADASLIRQTIARLCLEAGMSPIGVIEEGLRIVPEDYGLVYLLGQALLDAGRAEEALGVALRLRQVDPDKFGDGLLAFDRRIFREGAVELAAMACMRTGRRVEAAAHFAERARMILDEPR